MKVPRRVLMTADSVGGVWTYALELAAALETFGVEVTLATMGRLLSADQRAEAAAHRNLQVFESRYKLEWMEDPWEDVRASGQWLLALERQIQPEIIHLNGYCHAVLPWSAPALVVGHSCVMSWWQAVRGEQPPASWSRYRNAVRLGLGAADSVVAPSHAMLAVLREQYAVVPRGQVIPNARDAALFTPRSKEPFILSAGRLWDEAKNVAALESIAMRLPWPVLVAGEDRHPDGGGTSVQGVVPLGRLSALMMSERLGSASIYVLPARYEPFGLSVLEAALSGCALVLGDIDSLRENWHGAALFVPPEDTGALYETILELISNEVLRERLAVAALERGRCFTPQRMGQAYFSLYQQLASGIPHCASAVAEVQS